MRFLFAIAVTFLTISAVFSQVDSSKLSKYNPDFKFREGFYLSFEQVKGNTPLPKSRIIATYDYSDPDFFEKVLENDRLFYYDELGIKRELKSKNIWGYSRNGFIYIKVDDNFFRITLIGAISHFVASHTTYSNYNNYPYYNYYMDPYMGYSGTHQNTETRQYLFDFINGRVLDYTEESLEILLMEDPELHDEYMSLGRKKRKQQRFIFIRKFNEKHALYFPQN
jgi:hypothetical protein